MTRFEVGDIVHLILAPDNIKYAKNWFKSESPFTVIKTVEGRHDQVIYIKTPDGATPKEGGFAYRFRPNVFLTAAKKAIANAKQEKAT